MSNIFIKETKKFHNYITTTHCNDFKVEFYKYYDRNLAMFCHEDIFNTRKKKTQSLWNLYKVLRNNEFVKIKNYIYKEYSEEEKFEQWTKVLKNFGEFVFNFADPLFIKPDGDGMTVNKTDKEFSLTIKHNMFNFTISFEKSNIKKSNSSLFDSITGLDKENNLSFITIQIVNTMSNSKYVYKYMEDSILTPENSISEDICDLQLEYVKEKLDKYIYNYMGIVFDSIVNRELNSIDFCIFNSCYIKNEFNLEEALWLADMNMESD